MRRGLYKGLSLNYLKTAPNTALYLSLYDFFKSYSFNQPGKFNILYAIKCACYYLIIERLFSLHTKASCTSLLIKSSFFFSKNFVVSK